MQSADSGKISGYRMWNLLTLVVRVISSKREAGSLCQQAAIAKRFISQSLFNVDKGPHFALIAIHS